MSKLMNAGKVNVSDDGQIEGWIADPYGKEYRNELMMNPSIIRAGLKQVRRTLRAISEVLNAPRFE